MLSLISRINSCPLPPTNPQVFSEFLQSFNPVSGYKDIRKINPLLYDFTSVFFRNRSKLPETLPEPIERYLLTEQQLIAIWDQLFYQVIARSSSYVRQAAIQMIIGDNIIKHWAEREKETFHLLLEAKLVIPQEAIACFKPWIYRECSGDLVGVNNLGIADFRKVEQEVCCYVPGEVSHIENILAREYKERSTRNLTRSEQTIETTREIEIENITDVTTNTRNEITTEINSVLEEIDTANYGGTVATSFGAKILGAKVDVGAYADFANSNSSSFSNSTAKTYAEEVTKRALERVVQRTLQTRTSTIIREFEENNKHGFDNRKGDKNVTGIYRWVDIVYKNRLVNYGKRLMLEFMIPEPAEFFKRIQKYKPEIAGDEDPVVPEAPKNLSTFGISSPADINSENAFNAGAYFGVTINELPAAETNLTKSLSPLIPVKHERFTQSQSLIDIIVPGDYEADKITGSYTYEYRANSATSSSKAFCDFSFGGTFVYSDRDYSATKETKTKTVNIDFSPNLSGNIPVSVSYAGVFGFYGAVSIKCILKPSVISDWQSNAFNLLTSAYNQKLAEYESQLEQEQLFTEPESEATPSNPLQNRIIEQRELKRACIELITKPFCLKQGEDFLEDLNACDKYQIPQIKQTPAFGQYISQVKFFEQVFDWNLISYLFYPYYWADKCDWGDLMKSENDDVLFQAFLQAGMARVIVPVRPQFNEAVTYYMETGDIWLGGDLVPGTEDDLYLSISEDLSDIEGFVEEEWETRVPTTMAIVQDKSAKLVEEALPCCKDVENDDTTTNIKESSFILHNIIPVEEPEV